jgi:hypothetical protein
MSEEIKKYLSQLRQVLPNVQPVSTAKLKSLKSLHKARDYEGMVRLIRQSMNMQVRLTVGWVNSGGHKTKDGREAPAWIELPQRMPPYGTAAFHDLKLRMYLRKSFLAQSTFDEATVAIAHELSHVVLESIGHPLREEEKAVDLTAMLLGFRLLYKTACYRELHYQGGMTQKWFGYLNPKEVNAANWIISGWEQRSRLARPVLRIEYLELSAILCVLVIAAATFPLYRVWEVHDYLVQQQTAMVSELRNAKPEYGVLLSDVRVGIREMTQAYKVSQPRGEFDINVFERSTRENACVGETRTKIRDGAIYTYEFLDSSSNLIGRFSVTSCA